MSKYKNRFYRGNVELALCEEFFTAFAIKSAMTKRFGFPGRYRLIPFAHCFPITFFCSKDPFNSTRGRSSKFH